MRERIEAAPDSGRYYIERDEAIAFLRVALRSRELLRLYAEASEVDGEGLADTETLRRVWAAVDAAAEEAEAALDHLAKVQG